MLAWLLLPNLVLLFVYNEMLSPLLAFLVILPVASLLYFYCFPSFKWFAWFNIPFAFFAGFYAAYIVEYRSIPYEGMWFSVWDMVYLEFFDLGHYYLEVFIANLCGFALYLLCLIFLRRQPITPRAHQKPVILACLLVIMGIFAGQNFYTNRFDFVDQDFGSAFIQSYPLGMVFQAQSTWRESRRQEAVDYSSIPDLNRIAPDLQEREIYVLVIGETARADSWYADLELNHYENIKSTRSVAFSNAYSQANFTDGSLQLLMTGASSYQESDRQAPLPLVLKASDCQTIWISNNKAYRYASQADYSVVTDQSTSTPLVKRYDHALLPAIHRAITQSDQRSCLIVHLLGSHFSYHNRYGNSFMQKAVDIEDYQDKYSAGHVAALRNAYDNSIHATNDLLEQIIDSVKKQSATAMVMYTADHGENIYDDERGLFQHIMNPPSRYEVAVPFFIWVSDRFISNFPDKWSNLLANADRPISNKQVLPTFVDLLSVDYDVTHLDSSLFADYPIDAVRYVLAPDMRLLSENDIR